MRILVSNVTNNTLHMRRAHRERAVPLLPCERLHAKLPVHPFRRNSFHFPQYIRKAVRRSQPQQQMDVIRNSPDLFRNAIQFSHNPAKILVQPMAPFSNYKRQMISSPKYNMVMQAQVC